MPNMTGAQAPKGEAALSDTMAGMPLHLHLRTATRIDHDAVDAAFGGFGLRERAAYGRFLRAHARILPMAERLIDPAALLPGWQGRTAALEADLAALEVALPPPVDWVVPVGDAARWGALYVVEGSRLGGAVLARMIATGQPSAYLSARHGAGGWRELLDRLDGAERGVGWRPHAVAGAKAMFSAYRRAAAAEQAGG